MVSWKLIVEDYGKIKYAEIENAPLTLFVGDNNSGKSYLLALLWGFKNLGEETLLGNASLDTDQKKTLCEWIGNQVELAVNLKQYKVSMAEIAELFEQVLNDELKRNKSNLVRKIFNSQKVNIGSLAIKFNNLNKVYLEFKIDEFGSLRMLREGESFLGVGKELMDEKVYLQNDHLKWILIQNIYGNILNIDNWGNTDGSIYLPAARTGFMLTKDVINKVGRQNTFNISEEKEAITPFIRPINQFLDTINDLSMDEMGKASYLELAHDIEKEMANGIVEISAMPNKEVQYVPIGYKKGIPLRLTSAVVTELSPLILILKHNPNIENIFYEEPEMCLHPQLQHKMGKMIGRMVNSGIGLTITTHSDILLQHINNMIKLPKREDYVEICKKLGYEMQDFLSCEQVKVYQFESKARGKNIVTELQCGENGFVVPTFNDALNLIMDEAYEIQG